MKIAIKQEIQENLDSIEKVTLFSLRDFLSFFLSVKSGIYFSR